MSVRFLIVLWALWAAAGAGAAEVKIFRTDSRDAVLEGTLEHLRVDPLGAVELARRLERVASIEEPFVFCAAAHPDGWVVGTGNSGKVLKVDRAGIVTELFAAPEPEVFAVWAGDDGTVLAATSPGGKVYRVAAGEGEVIFDSQESYVWDLDRDAEGRLLVATGLAGRLYRVEADGSAEVLYESRDSHVRSIAVLPGGEILLGTAGQGLIVRIGTDGEATTLHDAVHPEVLAFAVAPSGTAYAAVLASEASLVDLSSVGEAAKKSEKAEGEGTATVTVGLQEAATVGSRGSGFSGPRSLVLEISPDGKVEQIADFQSETVHALLFMGADLWIGTGQEGRLYRWSEDQLILESVLEERQIAGLVAGGAGAAMVTANASALYRLPGGVESTGTFTSKVLDAGHVARFGSFLWRGSLPGKASVALAFRSGMSAAPDATWMPWVDASAVPCAGCEHGSGQETALDQVAHGRYVQWRARLAGGAGESPRMKSTELTYRPENLPPEIAQLEVLDPGQILVPGSFNPQNQTFEPWSPNREGIFTSLRVEAPKNGEGRLKDLWKKGYRTLRWTVKDANEDEMVYRLDFRLEALADGWLPMVEEIRETYYSFDSTVLPDGIYRFRLTASDAVSRGDDEALSAEKLSESVVIDHSPPVLDARKGRGREIEVELSDEWSPMRDVALSLDAGQWRPVRPADGILDGRREVVRIGVPEGTHLVLLRVSDAAHNVVTFDLLDSTNGVANQ